MVYTGRSAAMATDITPPLDSMMWTGAGTPIAERRLDRPARYPAMIGPTYADIRVVVARSYSRSSGHVSDEPTIVTPGSRWRRTLTMRCSLIGLA